MSAKIHHITAAKTVRYATLGEDITKARRIWFACHGYGQLVPYFIRKFAPLDRAENFVVAPEGLSRFYLEGFSGRVGATWMTKEERLTDIADYVNYLNHLHEMLGIHTRRQDQKLIHFGFSQGVATISRYIAMGLYKPDKAVFWAGTFPPDLDVARAKPAFEHLEVHSLVGNADPFSTPEREALHTAHLDGFGIKPVRHRFAGGHDILSDPLSVLAESL